MRRRQARKRLHSVAALTGVWRFSETSEKNLGSEPSRPIAIMTRAELTKTTLAIANPPTMKPSATKVTISGFDVSIDRNTPMLGR